MRTIQASEWDRTIEAYIWTECGNGRLYQVTGIRRDWWIVTGDCSWCCTPQTTMYVYADAAERDAHEAALRFHLAERRELWYRRPLAAAV